MSKINYQNLPSTSTPLNATNLNAMQETYEIGSNENGTYIKYDDGRLICMNEITKSLAITNNWGGLYASASDSHFTNFPMTFISRPQVYISTSSSGGYETFHVKGYPPSTTNATTFRVLGYWSTTQNIILSYLAIGRWKN